MSEPSEPRRSLGVAGRTVGFLGRAFGPVLGPVLGVGFEEVAAALVAGRGGLKALVFWDMESEARFGGILWDWMMCPG